MTLEPLILKMISYDHGSPERIQHFLKVHSFAKTIAVSEHLDEKTLFITEAAAIVHDIGIRLCLEKPEILKVQMRAILRAGVFGKIRMMFPMVSCMDELNKLLKLLDEVRSDLKNSNMKFDGSMDIGVMIEIPSAALIADKLAKKVDFFSIGTNDLVQYTLAVDRNNEKVAHLYAPTNPAVLELIGRTVDAAERNGIWVGVCGEVAGDPRYIPILIGLGVKELSMSPLSIGHIRRLIRNISMYDAERIAEKALAAETAEEALAYSMEYLEKKVPEILQQHEL